LIIYGGYLLKAYSSKRVLPPLNPPNGVYSSERLPQNAIAWAPGDEPALNFYPPGAACRFNPGGGLFKACLVHMVSENLTWQTPVKYLTVYILIFVVFAFLLGRTWCGWICPLGTLGDVFNSLRRLLRIDHVSFSSGFRNGLRIASYAILLPTLAVSFFIGTPTFASLQCYLFLPYCQICPARLLCPLFGGRSSTWGDFTNGITSFFSIASWIVLGLFVAAFFLGRRIWCHVCPIGLVNSWFNKGCATELRKAPLKCNRCASCADACPMGLDHVAREKKKTILNHPECVLCLRCVDACPRDGCLSATFFGKTLLRSKYRELHS
jgi:polyferredoxin